MDGISPMPPAGIHGMAQASQVQSGNPIQVPVATVGNQQPHSGGGGAPQMGSPAPMRRDTDRDMM